MIAAYKGNNPAKLEEMAKLAAPLHAKEAERKAKVKAKKQKVAKKNFVALKKQKRQLSAIEASVTDARLRVMAAAYVRRSGSPTGAGRDLGMAAATLAAILASERGIAAVNAALERQEDVIVYTGADVANEAWKMARKKDVSDRDKLGFLRFCAEMVGTIGGTAELLAGNTGLTVNVVNFAQKKDEQEKKPVIEAKTLDAPKRSIVVPPLAQPKERKEAVIDIEALG